MTSGSSRTADPTAPDDPLARLWRLRTKSEHAVAGLMSGTSADGIDAAIVRLRDREDGIDAQLVAHVATPHPPELQQRILMAASADARALARLDRDLGEAFAGAVATVAAAARLPIASLDLVGSHGQTVWHLPPAPGGCGITLQLGRSAIIAARTGLPVVSDFRARDMALGGHGAPLVPLVDHLLFGRRGERRVLLNLGGIANITATDGERDHAIGFDTGPANALMDALVRIATGGAERCDRDGARARRGSVDAALLAEWKAHPHFAAPPPKSLDRDAFGEPPARAALARFGAARLDDLVATAAALTVETIRDAVARLGPPFESIDRLIVSGGGAHNPALFDGLRRGGPWRRVEHVGEHGIPGDAKEAVAFAVLARETLLGRPGNLPRVTGAAAPAVLGVLTP